PLCRYRFHASSRRARLPTRGRVAHHRGSQREGLLMARISNALGVRASRGAALVIVLALLTILGLLAVTSMSMGAAELAMAGNEQYRRAASDAASAGIELAIARVGAETAIPSTFDVPVSTLTGHAIASVHYA